MAKGCLYCGLQLPDTADFCPHCGRPIERGFVIRPIQESEFDCLRKEVKGKDDLLRQQGFYYDCSGPHAHLEEYARPGNCPKCGARLVKRDRNTTVSVEKIESIAEENTVLPEVNHLPREYGSRLGTVYTRMDTYFVTRV